MGFPCSRSRWVLLSCLWAWLTIVTGAVASEVVSQAQPSPPKGLAGHRIVLDAGHGFTWNQTSNQWGWQRPWLHGEVEDLITARIVNRWLVGYLHQAGALVLTSRERDEQRYEIRLDDAGGSEQFQALGDWQTITPPDAWAGSAAVVPAGPSGAGSVAVWYADLPATATYGLCLWIPAVDTATTATYVVHTAGADVLLRVDQRTHTARWFWIDAFVFGAGFHPILTLTSFGEEANTVVVADAVRLGGGMGDYDGGGGASGLPRWQENSKNYAWRYGAPEWVWNQPTDAYDYGPRYAFTDWLGGDFDLHLHSNSDATGSGTASGTVSPYVYVRSDDEAQRLIWAHRRVTSLLKEHWLSTWRDRGDPVPTVYPTLAKPSWLIEVAFHDRLYPDVLSLVDPDFRSIAARGIYEGIAYTLVGPGVTFLPEPPRSVAVRNLDPGRVKIEWSPPAWGSPPTTYRLFTSRDGIAFDTGRDVGRVPEVVLEGLKEGDRLYVRVAAENEGGRSFPTETLGVQVGLPRGLLVVNGFDRLDQQVQETDNPRRFVKEHLEALAAARTGLGIDSASNEAVIEGKAPLTGYAAVDWILGLESLEDKTLSTAEQALLAAYLNAEGRLLISGTAIALDLWENGVETDRVFAEEQLHIEFSMHGGQDPRVTGREGSPFEGFSGDVSTTPSMPYDAHMADGLGPAVGGYPVLFWPSQAGAGIAFGTGPAKTLVLSVPLEALVGDAVRADLAERALQYLLAPLEPDSVGPSVDSVTIDTILATQTTIRWTASEPVIGQVEWGLDMNYGSVTGPTTFYARNGSLVLTGLQPETTYYAFVRIWDYAGNENVSGNFYTFTTLALDTTPPEVLVLRIYPFSDRTALVQWTTNEPARSRVEYGTDIPYGFQSPLEESYTTSHSTWLTGLLPDTEYHVRVWNTDVQDNTGSGADRIFRTGPVDSRPPVVEDLQVMEVSDRDAILSCSTSEPATAQVEWWTDLTTATLTPPEPGLALIHMLRIDGLTTDTLIHTRVRATDAAGNTVVSHEIQFRTLAPVPQVIVDNTDSGFSVTGTWATSTMAPTQRYGPNYRYKAVRYPGDPIAEARWRGSLPSHGLWQAHCWYAVGSNRSSDTPYTILYPGGEELVRVDQKNDSGVFFHPIGTPRYYPAGEAQMVMTNDATTGAVVIADAVMWSFVGLGDPERYRTITRREVLAHVLGQWPLDESMAFLADRNGDGAVDIADVIQE